MSSPPTHTPIKSSMLADHFYIFFFKKHEEQVQCACSCQ